MKGFDKFAVGGFLLSFGAYYLNKETGFANDLSAESYRFFIGNLPEYFTGVLGVRLANMKAEVLSKYVLNGDFGKSLKRKLPKKLENLIDGFDENKKLISTLSAGSLIVGFGVVDECFYNLSGGTQDLRDVFMYAAGVLTSGVYNLGNKKKSNCVKEK